MLSCSGPFWHPRCPKVNRNRFPDFLGQNVFLICRNSEIFYGFAGWLSNHLNFLKNSDLIERRGRRGRRGRRKLPENGKNENTICCYNL